MGSDQSTSNDLAVLKTEILHLREDMNKLMRIIMDGNGNSLISRMAVMENKIHDLDEDITKMNGNAWAIKLAMFSAILSFVGTFAILFVQFVMKRGG